MMRTNYFNYKNTAIALFIGLLAPGGYAGVKATDNDAEIHQYYQEKLASDYHLAQDHYKLMVNSVKESQHSRRQLAQVDDYFDNWQDKKEARQDKRGEHAEARKERRSERQEAKKERRAERKEARQEKRSDKREMRQERRSER